MTNMEIRRRKAELERQRLTPQQIYERLALQEREELKVIFQAAELERIIDMSDLVMFDAEFEK